MYINVKYRTDTVTGKNQDSNIKYEVYGIHVYHNRGYHGIQYYYI